MKTVGIISEYNPFHLGHARHIGETRRALGEDTAVVCVMSGNFVQRGDFAVFAKHARAKTAIYGGADLVMELPVPYVLQSAEGFAGAGVYLLDMLGICDYLSFGSESGNIAALYDAADAITSEKAQNIIRETLGKGVSYAAAQQKAADILLGKRSGVFGTPNNILGIEYIKAIKKTASKMQPVTVLRTGGEHDGDTGYSASAIRRKLVFGSIPHHQMPETSVAVCREELDSGRGPISMIMAEQAILSRLRALADFSGISGISEGLERRFMQYAAAETTVAAILEKVKTKRYPMSRLRRILMCAVLGITKEYIKIPPPYIRVLAMNERGKILLSSARKKAKLPVITKPASVYKLNEHAINLFSAEAAATDFYVLAYKNEKEKTGGREWRTSPVVLT